MATAQRAEPGTDVALASASVGVLPPEIRNALQLRSLQNKVASQLAGMNWGKALDLDTRRAVADWGRTMGVDVTTEIDVLGSNIYLNARFYLRKLGEMIAAGLVEYAVPDHVEEDARLKLLGPDGEGEWSRRLRERIKYNLPDKAASAVVFRVKLRTMDREVTGAKACGNGVKKSDPVGEAFPVETAESRAARRCMRVLASHVPQDMAKQIDDIESSTDTISARIGHSRNEVKAQISRAEEPPPGRSRVPAGSMPLLNPADPYSEVDTTRTAEMETVGRQAPVRVVEERAADEKPAKAEPLPGPHRFPMPFTRDGFTVGTPIGRVSSDALRGSVEFATTSTQAEAFSDFIAAAELVLDDRVNGVMAEPASGARREG